MNNLKPIRKREKEDKTFEEKVLKINRVSKTVTGGRTMSFSVFSAVGDKMGQVGIGLGKARTVVDAVKKSVAQAKKNIHRFSRKGTTIPHEVMGKFGATKVFMKPAPEGKGLVSGSSTREILELLGVADVFTKVLGSKNKINVARATLDGLSQLRTFSEIETLRGRR